MIGSLIWGLFKTCTELENLCIRALSLSLSLLFSGILLEEVLVDSTICL